MESKQQNIFDVDNVGRKAKKLGLSHDHEIVVEVVEAAKRLYGSLSLYQIGVVDCEMKRLSAGDRSTELTRLWNDTYTNFASLGSLLAKWKPVDEALDGEIRSEAATEKARTAEAQKLDKIDDEFKKFMGDDETPEDQEPEA